MKSRDRCAPRRTSRLKIFHGAEDFRSVHGRWPFGQTFSNGTSNIAKCLLSGKCTFNCTSKSKRRPLGSRASIVTRGAASVRSFTAFFQPSPLYTRSQPSTHSLLLFIHLLSSCDSSSSSFPSSVSSLCFPSFRVSSHFPFLRF